MKSIPKTQQTLHDIPDLKKYCRRLGREQLLKMRMTKYEHLLSDLEDINHQKKYIIDCYKVDVMTIDEALTRFSKRAIKRLYDKRRGY